MVLLVTGREEVVAEVAALAAAVGVAVGVVPDVGEATDGGHASAWSGAALVLVDADAVPATLPHHPRTVVVRAGGQDGDRPWRAPAHGEAGPAAAGGAGGAAGDHPGGPSLAVVDLPAQRQVLLDHLAAAAGDAAGGRTVAVVGACGGLGASSLSLALALAAARGGPSLLVDGDPLGGGLDLLAGLEDVPGLRWPDVTGARGSVGAAVLARHLPRLGSMALLSCARTGAGALDPAAVAVVLDAGRRGHGCVVVDLPASGGAVAAAVLAAADTLLLLAPAGVRGAAAVQAVLAALSALGRLPGDVRLVVRTGPRGSRPPVPPDALADALGVVLGAVLAHDGVLPAAAERGQAPRAHGRGALARACEALGDVLVPLGGGGPRW